MNIRNIWLAATIIIGLTLFSGSTSLAQQDELTGPEFAKVEIAGAEPAKDVITDPEFPKGIWNINTNAYRGLLNIQSINQSEFTGTIQITGGAIQEIFGIWDDNAKRIAFVHIGNDQDKSRAQIYTGYWFREGSTDFLTGYFEAFIGAGGTAQRPVFGWYAYKSV